MKDAMRKNSGDLETLAAAGVDVTLTPRQTMLALGISSLSTLWRWVRAGKVPPPFKLADGSDRLGFSARKIAEVQAKRKEAWTGEIAGKLGKPKSADHPTPEITAP